jgi:UDP-N-acetylmuramyl pentapeptide phosphotransferase/UDP-N-acetylglucosamine-1-phosphate transferase
MDIIIQCALMGLFGIVFQIGLKIRSIKEKALASNTDFTAGEYFRKDYISIFLSVAAVASAIFFIEDAMNYYENNKFVAPLLKLMFATLGYAGADIAARMLGRSSKMVNRIIDEKTGPRTNEDNV